MVRRLLIALALLCASLTSWAQLSTTQLQTLRTAILADSSLTAWVAERRDDLIASYYNEPSSPAFIAWKTALPIDNLSVGKARIWDWMARLGTLNCAQSNIRAGIDATWVGTAADLAVRATIYTHCKRTLTRAERLFATGTGSDAVPGTTSWQGTVGTNDVSMALNQ